MICSKCHNFAELKVEKGSLVKVCRTGHAEAFKGTEIIQRYEGGEQRRKARYTRQMMENMSYERTMLVTRDVLCPKCKAPTAVIIEPADELYYFVCVKCHQLVRQ